VFRASNAAAPTEQIAPSRKAGIVQTVLGPISGDRMGFTAPHEHVLASSTEFMRLWPEYLGGRAHFTSGTVERMTAAKAAGIDTIVDCATADLGRDPRLLQEVSHRSGVQIVATTGHWLTPTPSFEARTVHELADFFTLEIERGMEDTGIKPGVIKAAHQGDGMTPFQEKVFRAAAHASKRTGVPVTTHSDETTDFDYFAGKARLHLGHRSPLLWSGVDGRRYQWHSHVAGSGGDGQEADRRRFQRSAISG
jgi:predicted metal-dependent phosphotriesterase family hydrolase